MNNDLRNRHKGGKGIGRIVRAMRYSLAGYAAAWKEEAAFRQIAALFCLGVPAALMLGSDWQGRIVLILPLFICIIVELINSAIENAVDLISIEIHPLAKKAKDMGSAAQFTAQILLAVIWVSYICVII